MKPMHFVTAGTILAATWGTALAQPAADLLPLDSVARFELPKLDTDGMLQGALKLESTGGPNKFAEPFETSIDPWIAGTWDMAKDGTVVWRLVIESPTARNLNLGFTQYALPAGAELYIYSPDAGSVIGPFTDADNEAHGQLWTPIVPGSEVVVELQVSMEELENVVLEIGSINHGFRGFGSVTEALKSGSCNVDVVCPEGDLWQNEIDSVAVYTRSGVFACTGALVNNTANDRKPYFLTADHCGIGPSQAPSLVVYWNYENSTCRTPGSFGSGQPGNGSLSQFNSGAIFRAGYGPSDFTLVELDDPVNPATDPFFAGWDRTNSAPGSVVAIHHPNTDEKRISFEDDPLSITSYLGNSPTSNGTHLRVADWDLGTTEPGSSGSPIFDATSHRIVGQLHGGYAACGNNDPDWYGRIYRSWTGGGTSSSRLSNWLDPLNTGATGIDGLGQGNPPPPDTDHVVVPDLLEGYMHLNDSDYESFIGSPGDPVAGFVCNDAKNGTQGVLVPDLQQMADGTIMGIVSLTVLENGFPIGFREIPVVGKSLVSVNGLEDFTAKMSRTVVKVSGKLAWKGVIRPEPARRVHAVSYKASSRYVTDGVMKGIQLQDFAGKASAVAGTALKGRALVIMDEPEYAWGEGVALAPVLTDGKGAFLADAVLDSGYNPLEFGGEYGMRVKPAKRAGKPGKLDAAFVAGSTRYRAKARIWITPPQLMNAGTDLSLLLDLADPASIKSSSPGARMTWKTKLPK